MRMEHNPETHQVVMWTMGQAHVDEILARLRDRYGVEVEAEPFRTALRETFVRKSTVQGRHIKQSGGHGQYAVCRLEIEPLERGAGIEFVDKVVGGSVPRQFIPSVEKGARAQLEKGVLSGYPVVDVRVTLYDGKAHSVDSSDMAFQTAASLALKEAANEATVSLLEPIDRVDIRVSDDYVGAVMADLRGRRGHVLGHGAGRGGPEHRRARGGAGGRALPLPDRPAVGVARHGTFTRALLRYDFMPSDVAKQSRHGVRRRPASKKECCGRQRGHNAPLVDHPGWPTHPGRPRQRWSPAPRQPRSRAVAPSPGRAPPGRARTASDVTRERPAP